jgi:hypothetical protein
MGFGMPPLFTREIEAATSGILIFQFTIALTAFVTCLHAQKPTIFPQIKPVGLRFEIKGDKSTSEEIVIRTRKNKPAYSLMVYSISLNNVFAESISSEMFGIGEPSTRFDTKYEPNLLNPDRWGHGQIEFSPNDFIADEKGVISSKRRMVFELRRMRIEITVSDVLLNESLTGFVKAKITVIVRPSRATRSRPPDIPRPTPLNSGG